MSYSVVTPKQQKRVINENDSDSEAAMTNPLLSSNSSRLKITVEKSLN